MKAGERITSTEAAQRGRISRERLIRRVHLGEIEGELVAGRWLIDARSFESFLGFTPHPLEDFRRTLAAQRRALDPRLMSLIRDAHGAVAGFAVSYPDHADAIRAMAGKDGLGGRLRFLSRRGRTRRSVFYVLGLTPGQVARRNGLGRAGFHHMIASTLEAGYHEVVMALIAEGNRSRKIIGEYAERADKSYALYALDA